MKKIYFIIALSFASCLAALGQNLNPEVQVTNDYQTRLADVHKQSTEMPVPDSLTQFSTAIDYSVFKTEYRGAYDFSPYSIAISPEPRAYDGSSLFLRAGAGYSFHPVIRAVYTPFPKGLVRNSEYLSFDGCGGDYTSMDGAAPYKGHDYALEAGSLVRWNKELFDLSAKLAYDGIYAADYANVRNMHKGALSWNIHSNTDEIPVTYDIDADLHYAADAQGVGETGYELKGFICPEISSGFKLRIDLSSRGSWFAGRLFAPAVYGQAAPKAVFQWNNLSVMAGAALALSARLTIHPDIRVDWLAGDFLKVSALIGGGQTIGSYSSYKEANHWFGADYLTAFVPTVEKINTSLNFRGLVFKHLQYDLGGGYRVLEDAALQGLEVDPLGLYVTGVKFASYNQAWGHALLGWKSETLEVNADALYSWTDLAKGADYLSVPALTLETSAVYNWNRRAFAGLRCKLLTARETTLVRLPAFVDLGLYGEYFFTSRLAAWGQIGNILNQKLSYCPLHIAGGINFTAGVCLKLQ